MAKQRWVKVTHTGYMRINEDELDAYEANTYEEAVKNQAEWLENGEADFSEFITSLHNTTTVLKLDRHDVDHDEHAPAEYTVEF